MREQCYGVYGGVSAKLVERGRCLGDPIGLRGGSEFAGIDITEHDTADEGMNPEQWDEVAGEGAATDDAEADGHGGKIRYTCDI